MTMERVTIGRTCNLRPRRGAPDWRIKAKYRHPPPSPYPFPPPHGPPPPSPDAPPPASPSPSPDASPPNLPLLHSSDSAAFSPPPPLAQSPSLPALQPPNPQNTLILSPVLHFQQQLTLYRTSLAHSATLLGLSAIALCALAVWCFGGICGTSQLERVELLRHARRIPTMDDHRVGRKQKSKRPKKRMLPRRLLKTDDDVVVDDDAYVVSA